MKKRILATILVFVLVFSFASVALAYSTYDAKINIIAYVDSSYRFKPYTNYSSQMLYFTVNAQVYPTKHSTSPLVGSQYAQLLQIRATDQGMQHFFGQNAKQQILECLDSSTLAIA